MSLSETAWIALGALAFGALACSSSSTGTTNDQACADAAKARCAKTAECSTYFFHVRYGGDDANCQAREKLYCMNAITAPSTSKTPFTTEACVAAYPSYGCADWLSSNVPAACVPKVGLLGNASPCVFDGQCSTGFCAIPENFGCGKCAPPTKVGDSCASNGLCATEATGQYCASATLVCTAPVSQGAVCDNVDRICGGGFTCAGITTTTNGTCQPAVTILGADCAPTGQSGAGCDRHHGLVCDGPTKKCVAMTFAAAGQACGVVNNATTPCDNEGYCLVPQGQKSGTCVAVAADGAPCDSSVGPGCAYRSSCVVSSGTSGTCQPLSVASCH